MLRYWGLLLATCGIILTMYAAKAEQQQYIIDLYAYPAPKENSVTAVFGDVLLTKIMDGLEQDKIISIAIDGADRTELHTMSMDNDIMKMRKVDAFDVVSGETLTLSHSGDHIMVFDRENDWVDGETVGATLTFASGQTLSTAIEIQSRGEAEGHHAH